MIWIEMSKDETHGGGEWSFSKCVWAPTYKKSNDSHSVWTFWENIAKVQQGDTVIHIKWIKKKPTLVGLSTAASSGHVTSERPPIPGEWGYCDSYYRALLTDFSELLEPIELSTLFKKYDAEFRNYYKLHQTQPKNLFFVIQAGQVRCLNGAYLSPADDDLIALILGKIVGSKGDYVREKVPTSEVWKRVKLRSGQSQFAENVKANYHYQCCFPGCPVDDKNFLIGSHIARWVDNPDRRGEISNGLCFCPLHDRAFELGYFSISSEFQVLIMSGDIAINHSAIYEEIANKKGKKITTGCVLPSKSALHEHRVRCGFVKANKIEK